MSCHQVAKMLGLVALMLTLASPWTIAADAAANRDAVAEATSGAQVIPAAGYALVQAQYGFSPSGVSRAFSAGNTGGNTLIVAAAWGGSDTPVIADTRGNTYRLAKMQSGGGWSVGVWVAHQIAGGANAVTLTLSTRSFDATYLEYAGLVSTDQVAGASGSSGVPSSGLTPPTTQADEMVFGFAAHNSAAPTAGAAFTSRVGGVHETYVRAEDKRVTATQAQAADFGATSANWLAVAVTLAEARPASGGDTTPPVVTIDLPAAAAMTTTTAPLARLAGRSSDAVGVTACAWRTDRGSAGAATGTTAWSAANLPIFPGVNVITATCVDAAANRGSASATVTFTADLTLAGIMESSTSTTVRPLLLGPDVRPPTARGAFLFPAPYNTTGFRITEAADCGGADCVNPIGYSYWANASNSAGSDTMYVMVSLAVSAGGEGPSLFALHKPTNVVTKLGSIFAASDPRRHASAEGWYFSATAPTSLYVHPTTTSPILQRHDVLTRTSRTVFDISTNPALFGTGRYIWQIHSSNDDAVHSFTVRNSATYGNLGCGVFDERTATWRFYPTMGFDFDECQIDRSGQWLLIKEQIDGRYGEDNRFIRVATGEETILLDEHGGLGHSDVGFGYAIGQDNWSAYPTTKLWQFGTTPAGPGTVMYREPNWASGSMNHLSWGAANTGPLASQYACGSNASAVNGPRVNEVGCFRFDGSQTALMLAPVMTDMNTTSAGGDDYQQLPKGNMDPTGTYYIWSTNLGTNRTDVFMVKVPDHYSGQVSSGATHRVPVAPTAVSGLAGNAQVALAWTAPSDDGGAAISSYEVTLAPAPASGPATRTTASAATALVITGLANGTAYTATVRAANVVGHGPASSASAPFTPTAPVTLTVPGAPLAVTALATASEVYLTWTAPPTGGSAITGYTAQVSHVTPAVWTVASCPASGTATGCTVSGLVVGRSYTFRVAARNVIGAGAYSPPSNAVSLLTLPGQPGAPQLVAADGQVTATVVPATSGGAPSSYTVQSFAVPTGASGPLGTMTGSCTVSGASGSCVITGLLNGASYVAIATARNSSGVSDPSPASAPVLLVAAGPTALTVHAVDRGLVTLVWEPAAGAYSTARNYEVLVGRAPGQVERRIALTFPNGPADFFAGRFDQGIYFLRVRALSGEVASAPSNEVRVVVGALLAPSAPSHVLSLVRGTTVDFSWRLTYEGAAPSSVRLLARQGGVIVAQQDLGAVEQLTMSGVQPGTYAVTLAALSGGVAGPESAPVTLVVGVTGSCAAPAAPERLRVFASGNNGRSLTALWFPPSAGAAVLDYELRVSGAFVGTLPLGQRSTVIPAGAGTYHLSVVARNGCGVSAATPVRSALVP